VRAKGSACTFFLALMSRDQVRKGRMNQVEVEVEDKVLAMLKVCAIAE
jgi:hypothetical protein